ncbi:hydantoinase/oxoprolinase family protein [Candidatus Thorarchaeota archaeon]|nr:MAG: hydantoinase/oxoprolinase family protein [Candidatus Thorarchaeota archaeon]
MDNYSPLVFEMKVIGVDVGGTFTDVMMIDSDTGNQYIHKIPSIPGNQDQAVLRGIQEILAINSLTHDDVGLIVHGTTVATNAMLERKGAKVVLLTTAGFEDILEIGRQQREEIYSISASKPEPLISRENRVGVIERLDSEGNTVVPLCQNEIERVIKELSKRNYDSIAISLLFSFRNPIHEMAFLKNLQDHSQSYVVASSQVLPEFREFERTSTTVLEAYLGPLVAGYLEKLDGSLQRLVPKSRLTVMQSNGGTILASQTRGKAIGLAISGLAGGVIGGWEIAKQNEIDNAITLDMGGTSCDISAISGNIIVQPDNEIAGLPLRMPSVDVKTIGAGGGSIAWIDSAGILHVGPQSAGASPGPASYGKGGKEATITDANVLLGRLNPDFFLGGKIKLRLELAHNAIANIAQRLELSIEETALGIIRISTENMVQAIREVTVERGHDPRNFVLIPFGGAGPTQAVDIAESLNVKKILIPPFPGITSAFGLICTDLRVDLMQTVLMKANGSNAKMLKKSLDELSQQAEKRLVDQGARKGDIHKDFKIDMRYSGQSHELTIPIMQEVDDLLSESIATFQDLHSLSFGYKMEGREVEWVTARVTAHARTKRNTRYKCDIAEEAFPSGMREIILASGAKYNAEVYLRDHLGIGQIIEGPAIIEQIDTTTFIPNGWEGEQLSNGTLLLRRLS